MRYLTTGAPLVSLDEARNGRICGLCDIAHVVPIITAGLSPASLATSLATTIIK
jgi:hypothetical protein